MSQSTATPTTLPADVRSLISSFHDPHLGAKWLHGWMYDGLTRLGFTCQREYPVPDRGDGRRGRIDLHAVRGSQTIAIELDSVTPRAKSLVKLRQVEGARAIVLRTGRREPYLVGDIEVLSVGL